MVRFYGVYKCFNGFLPRVLQIIDDFLSNLHFGLTKVQLRGKILAILNQLSSVFSQHFRSLILLIHSKLLKSKLFIQFMCLCNRVLQQARLWSEHLVSSRCNFNQREELSSCLLSFLLSLHCSYFLNLRVHNSFDGFCEWETRRAAKTSFVRFCRGRLLVVGANWHSTF